MSYKGFGAVSVAAALTLGAIAGWYQYQRSHFVVTNYAYVSSPYVWVTAPSAGQVQNVEVVPGQRVGAGQVLVTLGRSPVRLVRAPMAGTVGSIGIVAGAPVAVHSALLAIVNLAASHVQAAVPEALIRRIHRGQATSVTFSTMPGTSYHGVVSHIGQAVLATTSPYLSPATGANLRQWVPVTVQLDSPPGFLRAGESATVTFKV
ncbi:MAG: HlyD family efflux transporter periplasmic adaptor subunit [Thermaerobacter sp.]|nr:HlyD family efflux transporter periplasmic adaptor subunit [Thermaerobacter sp.]